MKKLILLVVFCVSQSGWAAADALPVQDTDAATNEDAVEQNETDQDSETELAPADDGLIFADVDDADEEEESSRRFIPTEQISQDLGVSFPVDI